MSVQMVAAVMDIDDDRLTPVQRLVLFAMANYADEDGWCWPSTERLAKHCGVTERSVQRARADLCDLGFLAECDQVQAPDEVQSRYVMLRPDRRPKLYRLVPSGAAPARGDIPTGRNCDGVTPASPRGDTSVAHGVTPVSPEPLIEPLGTTTKRAPRFEQHRFDAWWDRYPRKRGKAAALKSYKRAAKTAGYDALDAGLTASLHMWRGKDPEYLPYPATWLNQGRWEDQPDTPVAVIPQSSSVAPSDDELRKRITNDWARPRS